ncbi:F-box/WD repeat-containing protein 7 isoform X2 [Lingula anatina]|uniref:F-box/WD repeat-containing protein 7 isoform X2 n=1 Tax=Lingula anatina TaxID=7574 RepID=A0A1S3IJZ2_LINAN|nr:F-box/WD repeat-containing protein 7 isoform X2 [Lingula anatina]|eukprot:XP_013398191.1 F-box/WD repeat-containing protein 7 isoform X2 [Lingula anatina]
MMSIDQPGAWQWRGLGGGHATMVSVEFDRQLDRISLWLEEWTHQQRCDILEGLLVRSGYSQLQFLWTVLQPALHRDFMYSSKKEFPLLSFPPVSTYKSREIKIKLIQHRQDDYFRENSAHFRYLDEVKGASREPKMTNFDTLEMMNREKPTEFEKSSHAGLGLLPTIGKNKRPDKTSHSQGNIPMGLRTAEPLRDSWEFIKSAPATLRFIEMPVRRHIQNERSPRDRLRAEIRQMLGDGKPQNPRTEHYDFKATSAPPLEQNWNTTTPMLALKEKKKFRLSRKDDGNKKEKKKILKKQDVVVPSDLPQEAWDLFHWYADLWDDVQRNEFLHKVVLKLDPRQHYFISSYLAVKQYRDFISLLPEPLALKILSYLSPAELLVASSVCRTWQRLANHNELWKSKCDEVTLEIPVSSNPLWKKVFRDNLFLKNNWSSGNCRVIEVKGHSQRVLSLTFEGRRLATGSADKSIKIWDLRNGHLIQTLRGHAKGVWCLSFFTKNLLVSGSYDGTLKVWNLKQGTTVRTMFGHEGPIYCMVRKDNIVVTGSQDRTAKVWDISRCLLLKSLAGHSAPIFAVDMDEEGKLAITGSADRSVKIWDLQAGKCKKTIWVSPTTSIMSVSYSQGFIACSYGEVICLYKLEGASLIKTFEEHQKRIECLELRITDPVKLEGVMVSAGKDGEVKYWDISHHKSCHSFKHGEKEVTCIHFDNLRIASASADQRIKIWDFNV